MSESRLIPPKPQNGIKGCVCEWIEEDMNEQDLLNAIDTATDYWVKETYKGRLRKLKATKEDSTN